MHDCKSKHNRTPGLKTYLVFTQMCLAKTCFVELHSLTVQRVVYSVSYKMIGWPSLKKDSNLLKYNSDRTLLLWFENIKGHPAFILFRCLNTVGETPRALACVALKAVHDLCHISSSSPPPHHFLCLHNLCCTPSKSRRRAAINSQQLWQ